MDNQSFFNKLAATIKDVADKDQKSTASANAIVDDFIKNYRKADAATKQKIVSSIISDPDFAPSNNTQDWIKDNILNPQITPPTQNNTKKGGENTGNGDFFKNLANVIKDTVNKAGEAREQQPKEEGEFIEYTYTPGDTFGRVLMKTGLSDGRNLWGPNGDVEYYTQQLRDQGINGNIPVGTKIRLRRRK